MGQKDIHFRRFNVTRELMCPHVKDGEHNRAILKSANMEAVDNVKLRRYAREGKRRAQTKDVENDTPHYSNEQDEVCNETFSCFNSIFTPPRNAGSFAGTRSILGTRSKN